jgi:hypothetical protein
LQYECEQLVSLEREAELQLQQMHKHERKEHESLEREATMQMQVRQHDEYGLHEYNDVQEREYEQLTFLQDDAMLNHDHRHEQHVSLEREKVLQHEHDHEQQATPENSATITADQEQYAASLWNEYVAIPQQSGDDAPGYVDHGENISGGPAASRMETEGDAEDSEDKSVNTPSGLLDSDEETGAPLADGEENWYFRGKWSFLTSVVQMLSLHKAAGGINLTMLRESERFVKLGGPKSEKITDLKELAGRTNLNLIISAHTNCHSHQRKEEIR